MPEEFDAVFTPEELGFEYEVAHPTGTPAPPPPTATMPPPPAFKTPSQEGTRGAMFSAGSWLNPPDRPVYLRPWFIASIAAALGIGVYYFTRKSS